MEKKKLEIVFHNPNSEQEMRSFLIQWLLEANKEQMINLLAKKAEGDSE